VAKFVAAYESSDLDSLVALLTDDVFISMPPLPFEYEGRDAAARFFASVFGSGRRFEFVRTRADGQPALGAYVHGPDGTSRGVGHRSVRSRRRDRCDDSGFDSAVLPWFRLPHSLPG
jgi:ketosteroid isomerase-like protein